LEPEEMAVAREWLVNTFPWQQIHKCNNRGSVGGCVFYAVYAEEKLLAVVKHTTVQVTRLQL
jgi:hypothetical protein